MLATTTRSHREPEWGLERGLPGKDDALPRALPEIPGSGSVSSLVKWILFCRFLSPVVKMKDGKAKTNLAIGKENPGLEVELDVFLQS